MSKQKLGRGLDSLLAENTDFFEGQEKAPSQETGICYLDPAKLKPNPFQPRKVFNAESLAELSDSIKAHGIIQPIVVEQKGEDIIIIAGERRTRAAILAGLTQVPVVFREYEDKNKLEIALIENIQRENLNPIEEAQAYQEIMNLSHLNQDETAKRVGKSRSAVTNALRLLQLPAEMRAELEKGSLTAGHARALLSLINPADQELLFRRIITQHLSVREAEQQAAQLKQGIRTAKQYTAKQSQAPKPKNTSVNSDVFFAIKDIEQQFINALGTKVEIKGNLEKGTISISYFSQNDLDSLYEKINGKGV